MFVPQFNCRAFYPVTKHPFRSMLHFLIRIGLACACLTSISHAETSVVVTLRSVADRVRAQNPELAAARLRIHEAVSRTKQAGRLANPNLETSFERNPDTDEHKLEVGFSQRFPLTNRLRLEKDLSAIELRTAEAEVREIERQLSTEARETTVMLLAARERRRLLQSQASLMKQFATSLAESAAKGESSTLDAGQAKLDAAELDIRIRQIDAEETSLLGKLKPLLGMTPGDSLSVQGTLPEPSKETWTKDPSRRPDLQKATLAAQAASQSVALEQSRRYDDIEGGLFASSDRSEDAPEGYDDETMIGVRLSIPLPLWNRNEAAIEEARMRKTRMENEAAALARNISLEADAALAEMNEWARMAREINRTLLPLAEEQSKMADDAYRAGQGEVLNLLRSKEKHLELTASRIDALREFHLARIRYESAIAKP